MNSKIWSLLDLKYAYFEVYIHLHAFQRFVNLLVFFSFLQREKEREGKCNVRFL